MLTFEDIDSAWRTAQEDPDDFYECMEALTGFSEADLKLHFAAWNQIPNELAEAIAERHGTTLLEGGFQAYLAHISAQDTPTEKETADGP